MANQATSEPIEATAVEVVPDVMEAGYSAGTEVEVAKPAPQMTRQDIAIADAAAMALEHPSIPGHGEFMALAMQARVISMSDAAPKAIRGKPYNAFLVLLTGRDLGVPATAALQGVHIIDGQVSLAPKFLNARLRQLGIGSIKPGKRSNMSAEAIPYGPDGKQLGEATVFTWQMAIDAELVMPDCLPGAHTDKCKKYSSKAWEKCRQGYKTYPERMLWWRAMGFCADDWFPEASMGLYSPEELGAVVDESGDPIDPGTAPLPPGFDDVNAPAQVGTGGEAGNPDDMPISAEEALDLRAHLNALPEKARGLMRAKMAERNLAGIDQLTVAQSRFVWAMVRANIPKSEAGVFEALVEAQAIKLRPVETPGEPATAPAEPSEPDAGPSVPEPEPEAAQAVEPEPVAMPAAPEPVHVVMCWCGQPIADHPIADHEPGQPVPAAGPSEGPNADELEWALNATAIMPAKVIDAALTNRAVKKTGDLKLRRKRLALLMAQEKHDGGEPDEF